METHFTNQKKYSFSVYSVARARGARCGEYTGVVIGTPLAVATGTFTSTESSLEQAMFSPRSSTANNATMQHVHALLTVHVEPDAQVVHPVYVCPPHLS